jgi:hypothetical protein
MIREALGQLEGLVEHAGARPEALHLLESNYIRLLYRFRYPIEVDEAITPEAMPDVVRDKTHELSRFLGSARAEGI